ncbi:MAG TPA: monooxygenase [Acidimicrobiaceae bacterium]|nr:monooxygenase [Acidimicrobiaceae bacterium]
MSSSPVNELFGTEYPIAAFSHCRDVVAAVSKAGGLGVLGAVTYTPEQLEVELTWIEEQVGDRPYGVDLLLPVGTADAAARLSPEELEHLLDDPTPILPEEHRQFVSHLLAEHHIPELPDGGAEARRLLNPPKALAEVAFAHPIRLIASALGPPPPDLVTEAHDRGVLVAALVGTKEHALRQKAAAVDVIVAQGYEAGGHTGTIATMVLVPEVVDAVAPTPVLAAGGIASGRQMAAAMALGAQGVWTGSVWLTTEEAETHPVVKEKLLRAGSSDTVRSRCRTGKPARQLRSGFTEAWDRPDAPEPLPMPLQPLLVAEAIERIDRAASAGNDDAVDLANYFVGQVVGRLTSVQPARQVLQDMVTEYVDTVVAMGEALSTPA